MASQKQSTVTLLGSMAGAAVNRIGQLRKGAFRVYPLVVVTSFLLLAGCALTRRSIAILRVVTRPACGVLFACTFLAGLALPAGGADNLADPAATAFAEEANNKVRQALGTERDYNWYDSEQDDTRAVWVLVRPKPAAPVQPASTYTPSTPATSTNSSFWPFLAELFEILGRLLYWLFWLGLLLLILVVLYAVFKGVDPLGVFGLLRQKRKAQTGAPQDLAAKIEALPVELPRGPKDLLTLSREAFAAGDHRLAMIYLFSYQLLQLDRHGMLEIVKGKTNRQYLRELRGWPLLLNPFRVTVQAFERTYFGGKQLTELQWETLCNGQQLIGQQLKAQ